MCLMHVCMILCYTIECEIEIYILKLNVFSEYVSTLPKGELSAVSVDCRNEVNLFR